MANKPPLSAFRNDISGKGADFPILNSTPPPSPFDEVAQEEPGYFQRIGQQYSEAAKGITSGIERGAEEYTTGVQRGDVGGRVQATKGLLRSGLRAAGGVARAAFAPVVEAPVIKQAIGFAGKQIAKIPGTDRLSLKAQELSEKYPEASKDIQNLVDIVLVGSGSGVEKPVATALGKTGETLAKSGTRAAIGARQKFAENLVMPVRTKAIKEAQVTRTTEAGLLRRNIVQPSRSEATSIQEVAKIPGIKPNNTYQRSWNIIRDTNVQKAQELEALVKANDFAIPRKEILSRLEKTKLELENSPLIVGDAQKTAEKMLIKARQIVEENAGTGSGLLKARKEFDAWVQTQKPKIFDANSENALTAANRAVRDSLNEIFDEKALAAGLTGTAEARASQSALYRAMENIQAKAAQEADTALGRALQRIGESLGTRNKLVQTLAAATGIGVFGAATAYALPLTIGSAGAWLVYRAGRLVMRPEIRKTVGELLQKHANDIAPVDRAFLEGLLQDFQEEDSSSGKNLEVSTSPIKNESKNQNINKPSLQEFLK